MYLPALHILQEHITTVDLPGSFTKPGTFSSLTIHLPWPWQIWLPKQKTPTSCTQGWSMATWCLTNENGLTCQVPSRESYCNQWCSDDSLRKHIRLLLLKRNDSMFQHRKSSNCEFMTSLITTCHFSYTIYFFVRCSTQNFHAGDRAVTKVFEQERH